MKKLVGFHLSAAAVVVVLALGGGAVAAKGGGGGGSGGGGGGGSTTPPTTQPPASTGTWPSAYPLPTSPGTVISQSSNRATVRSTDSVQTVISKLDALYVTGKHCTDRPAVNKPKDYLCFNAATGKTDEIYFTFAALDPTASDPSRSQSNAFYLKG
ncbi:MAG TPA: hypothetical protein VHQ23_10335 [Ilumatobacteraceae bacterium]|nr:hypothetical protein [Ilumatobacteraceae bacterium]